MGKGPAVRLLAVFNNLGVPFQVWREEEKNWKKGPKQNFSSTIALSGDEVHFFFPSKETGLMVRDQPS